MYTTFMALSSQIVFFPQNCGVTAFQLHFHCKNNLGSVKPFCITANLLRRSDRPKQPKNSIFAANLQFLRGLRNRHFLLWQRNRIK